MLNHEDMRSWYIRHRPPWHLRRNRRRLKTAGLGWKRATGQRWRYSRYGRRLRKKWLCGISLIIQMSLSLSEQQWVLQISMYKPKMVYTDKMLFESQSSFDIKSLTYNIFVKPSTQ